MRNKEIEELEERMSKNKIQMYQNDLNVENNNDKNDNTDNNEIRKNIRFKVKEFKKKELKENKVEKEFLEEDNKRMDLSLSFWGSFCYYILPRCKGEEKKIQAA